jgi:hypothetical protein
VRKSFSKEQNRLSNIKLHIAFEYVRNCKAYFEVLGKQNAENLVKPARLAEFRTRYVDLDIAVSVNAYINIDHNCHQVISGLPEIGKGNIADAHNCACNLKKYFKGR